MEMKMKYILVLIVSCLTLAHGVKEVVPDQSSNSKQNFRQMTTTTTLQPFTDSPSSNSESGSKEGFKVSKTVSKFLATIRESPSDLYLCPATFIRKDALLTTARCLFGREKEKLSVHSNSSNLETEGPGNMAIKNVYFHPDFDMSPTKMDFAIITLEDPLDYITPVSLPYKKIGRPGSVGTLYTWRFTPNTDKFLIHEHQSKIISKPKCFLMDKEIIPDGMACAETLPYKEGKYDNGMPFIINKKGKDYLFGLNYVTGKRVVEKLDKIWKVYEIVPWIKNKLEENDTKKEKPTTQKTQVNDDFIYNYGEEGEEEGEEEEDEEDEDNYTA